MAEFEQADTRVLAVTTTDQYVDFGRPMIDELVLVADATTVRVDFDQPTDASSFPLLTANQPVRIRVNCNTLHASTTGGTANLYILATRLNNP